MSTVASPRPFNQKKRLYVVQAGAAAVAVMVLLSDPAWEETLGVREYIEMTGLSLVLICILGRLWSILYVGSKKNIELVTSGPYSMTRNPLYFSSTVGAAGIGLMFGSVLAALALGLIAFLVFTVTASGEATFLKAKFGAQYDVYARKTPLFWPNPMRFSDVSEQEFSPMALRRTFIDGLYFLAIFPALAVVEYLHLHGYLPILVKLY